MSETYESIECMRNKLRNELAATKQKLETEQLHIKELREAIFHFTHPANLSSCDWLTAQCELNKALSKQPDTRALDKALLEAEIKVLEKASYSTRPYSEEFAYMIVERREKLAELNKEK